MSTGGYGQGGASGAGPSKAYLSLPYKGWREVATWVEEFIDSLGYRLDVLNSRFISSAARTTLLDATNADNRAATQYLATATQSPLLSTSTDTMLDILLYAALGLSNVDNNISIARKQALAAIGAEALKKKGTRLQLLNVGSELSAGILQGWTVPPNNFSLILPDGAPSPGWGNWVPADSSTAASIRPWILAAERQVAGPLTPAFSQLGVGYSQFRAGYSSAGETIFPVGSRINIIANEHFATWSAGLPVGFSSITGGGTSLANISQVTGDSFSNWEFSLNNVGLDLTGVASGGQIGISQPSTPAVVNDQIPHHFQIDYRYKNPQTASVLRVNIISNNHNGLQYNWNPDTQVWEGPGGLHDIVLPASSPATALGGLRQRFACDVIPQTANGAIGGTDSIIVRVYAVSDGTATTQTFYTLYRVGLYEKFNLAKERSSIVGERTAWYPLIDSPGWTTSTRDNPTTVQLEMADAKRSSYRITPNNAVAFDYHPAISGQGFRSHSAWTNLLFGSNLFSTDWSSLNLTRVANSVISPLVGETVPTAPLLTTTAFASNIAQGGLPDPSGKSFVAGVWVKKITADANELGTITVTQGSTALTGSGTSFSSVLVAGCQVRTTAGNVYSIASVTNNTNAVLTTPAPRTESAVNWAVSDFWLFLSGGITKNNVFVFLSQSEGWKLIPIIGNFVGGEGTLQFGVAPLSSVTSMQFSLASAYVYESTGKVVLYPPVCQTPVGSTAILGATHCIPLTSNPGVSVLHPLTRRTLGSVVRGSLNMTLVPTWDGEGNSASGNILFDLAQGDSVNRVVLGLVPGNISLTRRDNAGLTWSVNLNAVHQALTSSDVTWRRDTKIQIRCTWDENSTSLQVNDARVLSTTKPGGWNALDAPVSRFTLAGFSASKDFDGIIQNVELGVIGAPVS